MSRVRIGFALSALFFAACPAIAQEAFVQEAFATTQRSLQRRAAYMAADFLYFAETGGLRSVYDYKTPLVTQRALDATVVKVAALQLEVAKSTSLRARYDADRNRIVVPSALVEEIKRQTKGLSAKRRAALSQSALRPFLAEAAIEALYAGPEVAGKARYWDLEIGRGAHFASLEASLKDPRRFVSAVVAGAPAPKASGLSGTPHPSAELSAILRRAESGVLERAGYTVEVVAGSGPTSLDSERMRLQVSRGALDAIEAGAKSSPDPLRYRAEALHALLVEPASQSRQVDSGRGVERTYYLSAWERLSHGQFDTALTPSTPRGNYWNATTDALDRGIRLAYGEGFEGARGIGGLRVTNALTPYIGYDAVSNEIRVTRGLLAAIEGEARLSAQPEAFARQLLTDMVNRIGVNASGIGPDFLVPSQELIERGIEATQPRSWRSGSERTSTKRRPGSPCGKRPRTSNRTDVFARRGRSSTRRSALRGLKPRFADNRLQSYEDELEVLGLVSEGLRQRQQTGALGILAEATKLTREIARRDGELVGVDREGAAVVLRAELRRAPR
ncbi:MAG: hypothetical protein JKY65_17375 [Planctomycetes bacterium]|nr:hypothetical protein [Planctomycetota bacterium]